MQTLSVDHANYVIAVRHRLDPRKLKMFYRIKDKLARFRIRSCDNIEPAQALRLNLNNVSGVIGLSPDLIFFERIL